MPLALLSWVLLSQPTANTPAKDVELKELDCGPALDIIRPSERLMEMMMGRINLKP
jgi:hypothetical protein